MMIINFCNYFVSDINLKVPKQKNQTNNKKQKQQKKKNIYFLQWCISTTIITYVLIISHVTEQ